MTDHYPKQVLDQLAEIRAELAALQRRYDDEHATAVERAHETGRVRERLAEAQAELAALHAGEELFEDELVVPTPGQWIWRWNRGTPEQRLVWAEHVVAAISDAHTCKVLAFHERRIAEHWECFMTQKVRAEQAEARIAAARALHQPADGLGHTDHGYAEMQACTSCGTRDEFAIAWPCSTIAALDGPADPPACCVCGSTQVVYRNYREQPFCSACAEGCSAACSEQHTYADRCELRPTEGRPVPMPTMDAAGQMWLGGKPWPIPAGGAS